MTMNPQPPSMRLTVPQYLMELHAARDTHYLDWDQVADRCFRKVIGSLTIDLAYDGRLGQWQWSLHHASKGTLFTGASETVSIAMLEALSYARSWVQQQPQLNPL
jgi:hypothetical protein